MVQTFRTTRRMTVAVVVIAVTAAWALTGFAAAQDLAAGPVTLTVWHHDGQATERVVMTEQVVRFNAAQHDVVVNVVEVPEVGYADKVQLAGVSGTLPDGKIDTDFTANHGYEPVQ
ncbi:MAG TPA: hypothetical protein VLL08_05835 [Kineosporiaceae bacterium]|nr:hypothetical protein [Kineosporiaceae bacterium]